MALLLFIGPAARWSGAQAPAPKRVVFVCEHGSVKSVIAASLFNRIAREQGLNLEAIARGMAPDDTVPSPIAASLLADGFDVRHFKPQSLTRADVHGATRVVAIGADVTTVTNGGDARVDRWDAIPPTSEGYAKTRDGLDAAVRTLVRELQRTPHQIH